MSWAQERKQVAVLQQELLHKEFEARKGREKEAHALSIKVMEKKLMLLELQIKIAQKQLAEK